MYKKAPGLGVLTVTMAVPKPQVQGVYVSTLPPNGMPRLKAKAGVEYASDASTMARMA